MRRSQPQTGFRACTILLLAVAALLLLLGVHTHLQPAAIAGRQEKAPEAPGVQLSDAADFLLSFSSGGSFDAAQFSNAGTMLAAFKRWQETVLQSLQDGNSVPRVVLVKPVKTGGLGNRMPSLVTGVLMAALTGRLFMVQPSPGFTQYLQPVLGHDWLEYANVFAKASSCSVDVNRLLNSANDWCGPGTHNTTIVVLQSWDWDAPFLQVNPGLAATLVRLFPDGSLFHAVASFLFRPAQAALDALAPYSSRQCLVGVHMRTTKGYPAQGRDAPQAPPLHAFAGAVRVLAQHTPGSIFVAADTDVFGQLAEQLPGRTVWWSNLTQTTIGDRAYSAAGSNPGTDLSAVVDLLLLSRCQHLVVTSGSSFGFVAAGLGNIKPAIVVPYTHDHPFDSPWFWLSPTSEPCLCSAGKWGLARMPVEAAEALNRSHPLFLYFNSCHP